MRFNLFLLLFMLVNEQWADANFCSSRFENMHDIKKANPLLTNCTYVKEKYPTCAKTITVEYFEQPPYVVASKDGGRPIGLLPDILWLVMEACCFGCYDIRYKGPVDYLTKFRPSSASLFMPVQSSVDSFLFNGHDFIPTVKVSKVDILAKQLPKREKADALTDHMLSSVIDTWPLFFTAMLMAITTGCAMWTIDAWFNEENFPQRFPRGPFEGFWWAFVSMTTVGYGDKVPDSFHARIFSIFWIFLGITVFNMYTAVLTSALSVEPTIFEVDNFSNKKVGVLHYSSAGETVVLQEHGNHVIFDSIDELAKGLEEDNIKGIALDANIVRYYFHHIKKTVPLIRNHHTVSGLKNAQGMLSQDRDLTDFIRSFFVTNSDHSDGIVSYTLYHRWPNMKHEAEEPHDAAFYDPSTPTFRKAVIGLVVLCILLILIGIGLKFLFSRKKDVMWKCVSCFECDPCSSKVAPSDEGDTLTIEECARQLDELTVRWKDKLEELRRNEGYQEIKVEGSRKESTSSRVQTTKHV